jgi:hypothetical protein
MEVPICGRPIVSELCSALNATKCLRASWLECAQVDLLSSYLIFRGLRGMEGRILAKVGVRRRGANLYITHNRVG